MNALILNKSYRKRGEVQKGKGTRERVFETAKCELYIFVRFYEIVNSFLSGCHQANTFVNIRMPSHRLLRLVLSTGLMEVDCQEFLSTSLIQVV